MRRTGTAGGAAAVVLLLGAGVVSCTRSAPPADYVPQIEAHRAEREARLRAEDGWLSLIGLFWLEAGENRVGSDPSNWVVLPEGAAPAYAGSLFYEAGRVRLVAAEGAGIALAGKPVATADLADDSAGNPDVLELGRLRFHVIARDGRHAVRVKDPESPARRTFAGLDYFPIDPEYRVRGTFVAHDKPVEIEVPTVLGTTAKMIAPGIVRFHLRGREHTLTPLLEKPSESEFFFIFKDETSGVDTYPACRYLYGTLEDGHVWLDFNVAYNPPCAFSPHATCPLPPPGNRLPIRVEAGEKAYAKQKPLAAAARLP